MENSSKAVCVFSCAIYRFFSVYQRACPPSSVTLVELTRLECLSISEACAFYVYLLTEQQTIENTDRKFIKIKMGKTRKGFKNEIRAQEKTPLDEQITSGKVVRSKNKVKIRLRAEEEDVSRMSIYRFSVTCNRHYRYYKVLIVYSFCWFSVCRCTIDTANFASGPCAAS